MARTPQALDSVCHPRIEAVGRFFDSFLAALANGSENAIVSVQMPSLHGYDGEEK